MIGRREVRATAGLYPAIVIAVGRLVVLGVTLIGLGTVRLLSQSGASNPVAGTLEPACAGYTCAPLLVPVVLVVTVAIVLGASWLARETI
jgi:hypothetical protein